MRRALAYLRGPEMLALRARYAGPIAFVRARLSPQGYLGLKLTVAALVLVAFSWLFGGIAEDVVSGDPLTLLDLVLAQWFANHVAPSLAGTMLVVSGLHGLPSMSVLFAVTAAVLAWRRNWSWLMVLVLSVPGGMLVNVLMKLAFHRARPVSDHPLLVLTSYSFPSGHVAGATLFYGLLAAMYASGDGRWGRKVMAVLGATALVALVALSRMVLGVHYLSDVLAAFAEGVAWLTVCIVGVRTYWQYRAGNQRGGSAAPPWVIRHDS
jgi:membrane-associated phospholipid phosphatase